MILATSSSLAIARPALAREDRLIGCLIGEASISLQLQQKAGTKLSVREIADIAVAYAGHSKACKSSPLSEGGLDYIQASVEAMAQVWFGPEG